MVTLSEYVFRTCSKGGVGVLGIMPGVPACVTLWCVIGAVCIWDGAVGVDKGWLVVFGVGAMLFAVVPKHFSNFCKAPPWSP